MKLGQAFKMAFKSILGNKARTVLTMLGIIIGVAAVITLVSLVQGYQDSLTSWVEMQGTNRINVYAHTYDGNDITDELYDFCLNLGELVVGVTPNTTYWGVMQYKTTRMDSSTIYFGSEHFSVCNNYQLASGRDLAYLDIEDYHKVCVIGAYVAEALFGYTDPIGKTITVNGTDLTVVGVYVAKEETPQQWGYDDMIAIPYTVSRFIADYSYTDGFTIKAKDRTSTTEAITRINAFLSMAINPQNGYYNVNTPDTQMESDNELTNMLSLVLGGIAGIALLVGGIGIMNIMLVTVTERTREIGIRKAIGAKRSAIVTQFLIESGIISMVGGMLGVLFGFILTVVLGKLIFDLILMPQLLISVGSVLFSLVIGIGFGIYPAVKASGLQPVEALRAV